MNTGIPLQAKETNITPFWCLQRVTEPRIPSPEHCQIHSPQTEYDRPLISSRVMNPSKPTSFRNTIQITREEMSKYFHCPQRLAAQKLGVSLSTLKRRFYQLDIGRWPYQLTLDTRRRSIWHLVSEEEPKSEKELSPDTVQTLSRLFSMSLQQQQLLATQGLSTEKNLAINTNESPSFKFLHYVPRDETSLQSQIQSNSIPSSPSNSAKGIHKRPRRFLQLDDGKNVNEGSSKGTTRKRQKNS